MSHHKRRVKSLATEHFDIYNRPHRNRNVKQEVVFKESSRREYVTGFHKRKMQRRKHGLDQRLKQEREKKIQSRKERKEAMMESLRALRGGGEVDAELKRVGNLSKKQQVNTDPLGPAERPEDWKDEDSDSESGIGGDGDGQESASEDQPKVYENENVSIVATVSAIETDMPSVIPPEPAHKKRKIAGDAVGSSAASFQGEKLQSTSSNSNKKRTRQRRKYNFNRKSLKRGRK